MNKFMNGLVNASNYGLTENSGIKHLTTRSDLLDMFAMGAAMRARSDADVIQMFRKAFQENPTYALKCLFYIRDVRGGQGERRFFRVVMKDLATWNTEAARRNLMNIPEYGRYDDLYVFVGTPLQNDALNIMKNQLALDMECKTPSLLAKWLKSCNTSSQESCRLGNITRKHFGMTHRQYRKTLSILRARINVLERLMSAGKWDEIEFDKIPSKAGMIYKNTFARHDIERAKSEKQVQTYEAFAKDITKKVNAKTLYPYECIHEAAKLMDWRGDIAVSMDNTNRLMVNKYWENLADYFNKASLNALAVVDTSASMRGTPLEVAISLGMYCAEKAGGPFANYYISFSSVPQLINVEGVDFCDKVARIWKTDLCENTNIEATFDMLLNIARQNRCTQEDLPQNIIVISDMEFDEAAEDNMGWYGDRKRNAHPLTSGNVETVLEGVARKWAKAGYKMPHLIFWNVRARQNNIPMLGNGPISYVSGFSPSIFQTIMTGKTGYDMMMEVLNSVRYAPVY